MTFCIGYDQVVPLPRDTPFPRPLETMVGCTERFPSGTLDRTVDYDASNTSDWADFVARLTDGVDDEFQLCQLTLTAADLFTVPSSCSHGPESLVLSGNPDLAGSTIEAVRLIVRSVVVSLNPDDGSSEAQSDITWQILGTPPPPPCSLETLAEDIEALDESYSGGLLAKVSAAERLVDRGQTAPAINKLEDLINQLEAKRDNQIPGATVDELVACVDRVIDELSAGS